MRNGTTPDAAEWQITAALRATGDLQATGWDGELRIRRAVGTWERKRIEQAMRAEPFDGLRMQ